MDRASKREKKTDERSRVRLGEAEMGRERGARPDDVLAVGGGSEGLNFLGDGRRHSEGAEEALEWAKNVGERRE